MNPTSKVLDQPYPPRPVSLSGLALFGGLYFVAAALGYALAFPSSAYWPFCPANGLLLGALALTERGAWGRLWAVTLPGALLADALFAGVDPSQLLMGLAIWLANTLEPLAAAWVLRRVRPGRFTIMTGGDCLLLAGIGAILAPAMGAVLGAAADIAFDGRRSFGQVCLEWWIGDAMGMLVVAPVVITWGGPAPSVRYERRGWPYLLECLIFAGCLVVLTERAFHTTPGSRAPAAEYPFFVILPLILWAGLRFEPRVVSLAVLLIACLVIWRTTRGFGAIAGFGDSSAQQGLLLQGFLAQVSSVGLLFSTGIERRELVDARLRSQSARLAVAEREERQQRDLLQSILDSMGDAVLVVDSRQQVVLLNPAAHRLHHLGAPPPSLADWPEQGRLFLLDGRTPFPEEQLPVVRALRGERCEGVRMAICAGDTTEPVHVQASARPMHDTDGSITGAVVVRSDITAFVVAEREQARLIGDLQQALAEIRTLRGLIPLCARCQKVRNDAGAWERFEAYAASQIDVQFAAELCPECHARPPAA